MSGTEGVINIDIRQRGQRLPRRPFRSFLLPCESEDSQAKQRADLDLGLSAQLQGRYNRALTIPVALGIVPDGRALVSSYTWAQPYRPVCLSATRSPAFSRDPKSSRMVGSALSMRWVSVILPCSMGTLKSTRKKTVLSRKSRSSDSPNHNGFHLWKRVLPTLYLRAKINFPN